MPADSLRSLHPVVSGIDKARAVLIDRGAEVSPVEDLGGVFYAHRRADHAGQDGGAQSRRPVVHLS